MNKIDLLIQKGVRIPNPGGTYIGDRVRVDRISGQGVIIYPGCRLIGEETFIADDVHLGYEAPVTVEDCYLGSGVSLKGGFFRRSAFLEKASCGSGAQVREGTILEEGASIAHTVGLKQTILFPYVTLGSLINFCDCLMAGGTNRRNHSEVGSSYIHFNYTPNQDKATPSLLGDVPRGVMLNQSPIFLGGQGGLVGPCYLNYGTVVAAGTICRHDEPNENHLVFGGSLRKGSIPRKPGGYPGLKRILINNIRYISNLIALRQWYGHVRRQFVGPRFPEPLLVGLGLVLDKGIDERIKQLDRLAQKIKATEPANGLQKDFPLSWSRMNDVLHVMRDYDGATETREHFLSVVDRHINYNKDGANYPDTIHGLSADEAAIGTVWLDGIVERIIGRVCDILPALKV
jgi:bifunctional UDP-N-acetylglucosamine pyrophosphorylase / glucosamine-1-phosphate N-acetyltransferase